MKFAIAIIFMSLFLTTNNTYSSEAEDSQSRLNAYACRLIDLTIANKIKWGVIETISPTFVYYFGAGNSVEVTNTNRTAIEFTVASNGLFSGITSYKYTVTNVMCAKDLYSLLSRLLDYNKEQALDNFLKKQGE